MPEETITSRLERVLEREQLDALQSATVAVLGLGGVGSNCVEALARGGVGGFVLVDHDVVQPSNINRQAIAYHSTLGQKKTEATRNMILDINPDARIRCIERFVLAEALDELFAEIGPVDYVIDAIDTISTKLALAKRAQDTGMALISSMGGGNKFDPEQLHITDLYKTVNCRMCRIMRKEGRKRGIEHLRVLYSSEEAPPATAPEGTERRERAGLGTMSYIPPIMGQMIAGDVIRTITGLRKDA